MNYFTSKTAEQLTLVSISHAREGKAGELKKACLDLIEKTRQEEGAISYHLYEDREDPCQFIFQTKNFGKNIPKVNICKLFGPAETN